MERIYRQSLISSMRECPLMTAFNYVYPQAKKPDELMSAAMGTAGHLAIERIHEGNKFGLSLPDSESLLEHAINDVFYKRGLGVKIGVSYDSLEEHLYALLPKYSQLIHGYSNDERNYDFKPVMIEGMFALKVFPSVSLIQKRQQDPSLADAYQAAWFTGTIDQAGYYASDASGKLVVRDVKFRQSDFRPNKVKRETDVQMTMYAHAANAGRPACEACAPKIRKSTVFDTNTSISDVHVDPGMCEACSKRFWPKAHVSRCEWIWMMDYRHRKRDEFPREIIDRTRKVVGASGRKVFAKKINPEWAQGYKKGDRVGPVIIATYREPERIERLLDEVLMTVEVFRRNDFYRNPGQHCTTFCQHNEPCVSLVNIDLGCIHNSVESFEME